jgi:predicted Ser/Thr protein kinase
MFLIKMERERKRSRTLNDYRIIKQLGQGAFGKVYLAINPAGKRIALKVIDIPEDKPYLFEQTRNELSYLQRLAQPQCSPHVICYYGGYENREENQFLVEMEYIDGLELDKYIERLRQTQPPEVIYYYLLLIAKAVTDGLNYSHRKGIVHNDIKPANIMIDSNNVPRVVDFGLACSSAVNSGRYCVSTGGTPKFISPEYIIQNNTRYPASDMWALGVTLYYLATGQDPFDFSNAKTFGNIFDIIRDKKPRKLNTTNQQLNNLVNGLLVKDPNRRLSGDQVINMLNVIPQPGVGPVVAQVPAVPLARVPAVPLARVPAVPLARVPAVPLARVPAVPLAQVPDRDNLVPQLMDISSVIQPGVGPVVDALQRPAGWPGGGDAMDRPAGWPGGGDALQRPAGWPGGGDALQRPAGWPGGGDAMDRPAGWPGGGDAMDRPAGWPGGGDALQRPAGWPGGGDAMDRPAGWPGGGDARDQRGAQVPDRNNLGPQRMDISSVIQPMDISKSNLSQRSKLNNMDKKTLVMSLIF